jgi:DNA-binding Xre family transcriptional regulator
MRRKRETGGKPIQLRLALQRRGMSLGDLRRRTGLSRSTVSELAAGLRSSTLFTAKRICDALDCSLQELITGVRDKE